MYSASLSAYPINSPRAAARILALALISNGKIQPSELAAIETHDAKGQLAISDQQWHDVVHDLCVDLLLAARHGPECRIDSRMIQQMFDEVDDMALQRRALRLCIAVVNADGQIEEGESAVLLSAVKQWQLHPDEQTLLEPLLYGLDFQVAARCATARHGQPVRGPTIPCAMLMAGLEQSVCT
jgi:hypothetical protein